MIRKSLFLLGCIIGLSGFSFSLSFAAGWKQDQQGAWYELDDGSYYRNSWVLIDDDWYFFDENGYISHDWIYNGGKWYYCDPVTGVMLKNTTVDGYFLGSDGAVTENDNPLLSNDTMNNLERNTIKATVDGVERVFYLTSAKQYGDNVLYTAYSVENGKLGPHLKLEFPCDATSGSVFTEKDADCDVNVKYGKTPHTTSFEAKAAQGRVSGRGTFECNLRVVESNGSHVKGTFSAVAKEYPRGKDTLEITNGSFDLYEGEEAEWVNEILTRYNQSMREIEYEDRMSSGNSSLSNNSSSGSSTADKYTCRTCHGTGRCTRCGGDGLKINNYNNKVYNCISCNGTGKCAICYGTGKVY